MNYQITLAYEHCVVSVSIYGSPDGLGEDELASIALHSIESDFGSAPLHFHDVEVTNWND